ncbi:TPR-like protein [Athelia psychrophila]|uniref:TPR-like protein n=1 Tax=Athelia psychrophila TaxID=1759441 RepID=A0A166X2N3_9AGAM|nr:TPR-like protein [Fibularhizoctonia sp. CBS 109695]
MALPMLVGGSDCGPSNPLQNLSKRFDQDRGIQQDHFSSRAGSSREAFRTQAPARGPDQDAARFFSSNQGPAPQFAAPTPFDLSPLNRSLPAAYPQQQQQQQQQPARAGWATDFMQVAKAVQSPSPQVMSPTREAQQERNAQMEGGNMNMAQSQAPMNWNPAFAGGYNRMNNMQMPAFTPQMPMQQQQHTPSVQANQATWDKEFASMDKATDITSTAVPHVHFQDPIQSSDNAMTYSAEQDHTAVESAASKPQDTDELARTAGMLVDSVRDEQNPKFKNSAFMGLMRQLRDHEVVVDGDKMVENAGGAGAWASEFQSQSRVDVKGKGRAVDRNAMNGQLPRAYEHHLQNAAQNAHSTFQVGHSSVAYNQPLEALQAEGPQEESAEDAYLRQENAEFAKYWSDHQTGPALHATSSTSQAAEWGHLQEQWDSFEASATGIRAVEAYPFQQQNPYLAGDRSRTRHHSAHLEGPQSFYESVLEMEAAVQRDPQNAAAWYELGVKQQENEREHKAIVALRRAVELDPTHLPTWVALGVSYTNDNNRMGTYDAINQWLQRNDKYKDAVMRWRAENPQRRSADAEATIMEKFSGLIECLISVAREGMSGEVDADVQIALAVLLNTNEDYEKAHDCFRAALAVRPTDWLLYNRVGATLANSGRANDALEFYYGALSLNPAYIRARYNLGISCNNLRRYDEAAQHILDALVLQDSDGVRDTSGLVDNRGITSSALWDSLKTTCMHMQRAHLAALCDRQDLEGFRQAYHESMMEIETHA